MTEYTETVGDLETVTSDHPVLTTLKERIATLENEVSLTTAKYDNLISRYNAYRNSLREELLEVAKEYPNDKEIIVDIAERMSVELSETKTYEVNVTFKVEIDVPFGEEASPDFDWDFEYTIDSSAHAINDYSSDVVYANEN